MKVLFQLLLIAIIVAASFFGQQYLVANAPELPTKEVVPFVPVVAVKETAPGPHTLYVDAEGTLTSPSRLALAPEVAGRVVRVNPDLHPGNVLKQGAELIAINEADYVLAVDAAVANIAAREASLALEQANAQVAIEDWKTLHEGTPPVLVSRGAQIKAAQAAVQSAKVGKRQAELALKRAVLRMPFDGRIISRNIDLGQQVSPNAPLLTIERTDDIEVQLSIAHHDLAFIGLDLAGARAKGLKMEVHASIGGQVYRWAARGKRTVPMLDSRNPVVTLIAELQSPLGDGPKMAIPSLLPGLFVTARIEGRKDVICTPIPRQSLQVDGSFFTVDSDNRLHRQTPKFLKFTEEHALIEGDLNLGQPVRVVTRVPTIAVEGMQVRVSTEMVTEAPQR